MIGCTNLQNNQTSHTNMTRDQQHVRRFMALFGQDTPRYPTWPSPEIIDLRKRLIAEEVKELFTAIDNKDLPDVADALADTLYVVFGTCCAFGIDIDPIFCAVHQQNIAKLWLASETKDAPEGSIVERVGRLLYKVTIDGKVIKPPGFTKLDFAQLLLTQTNNS